MTPPPDQILSAFRGRPGVVAVGNGDAFAPVERDPTPAIIDQHLRGEVCYGFYLMRDDNTVWCSCIDIDNKPQDPNPEWKAQAEKVYYELAAANLQPLVEISQSGTGVHIWLFYSEPVAAWLVRAWWKKWEERVGFRFKEIYPKQDHLSGKGYGNLVRYPYWGKSRFVDVESDWCDLPWDEIRWLKLDATDLNVTAHRLGMGTLVEPAKVGGQIDGLSLRVKRLIDQSHTLIGRRWLNDARDMNDPSPSAVAMSIACELVRCYIPTAEIEAAVRVWLTLHARQDKAYRADWIAGTVAKAYDFTIQKTETRSVTGRVTFRDCCHEYLDKLGSADSYHIGSGIRDFDACVDGVAPGEIVVLAARPNHGKSAFAFSWVDNAAAAGHKPLVISEEMSRYQTGMRRVMSVVGIKSDHLRADEKPSYRTMVDQHHDARNPIYFVEGCGNIERVEQVIDEYCQLEGVDLVAVDYVQLIGSRAHTKEYEVVTEVSRRIKQAAQRNKCGVLLLSQTSRDNEKRGGPFKMSDLRSSGQLEQDADMICFLSHPWKDKPDKFGKQDYFIQVPKRRNGPIREQKEHGTPGVIKVKFNTDVQKFL